MKRLNARGTAKYVFTALLVWWILRTVPLAHIVEAIRNSHTQDVLAGILALVVARPIMALRMKRITDQQGLSLTVPQLIEISLVSTFYGAFLPGSLSGGLIRWHRIASQDQKPTAALTAIAFDRLMDTITAVTFGLVCWIASAPERNFVGLGLVTAFLGVTAVYLIAFHPGGSHATFTSVGKRIQPLIPAFARRKLELLSKAASHYHTIRGRSLAVVFALSMAVHVLGTLSFAFLARSLGMEIPFMELAWIRICAMLIGMVPFTIGGLGMQEGALLILFRPYGYPAPAIVALSFMKLVSNFLVASLGGMLELQQLFTAGRQPAATRRPCESA
jgi:uncharacterized protein (TIRG00374 family)